MEKLRENLPIASVFLLVLGAIRLIYYYKFFNVDITSYIDLSEVLSLSISFFINSAIILLIFLVLLTPSVVSDIDKENKNNGDYNSIKMPYSKRSSALLRLILWSFMIFLMSTMYDFAGEYTMDFRVSIDSFFLMLIAFSLGIFMMYLFPVVRRVANEYFEIKIDSEIASLVMVVICVTTLCIAYSRNDARSILLRKKAEFAEVTIGNNMICSSDKYRYIGKTKNYVLFYNTVTEVADVYPLSNAVKVSVPD